MPKVSQVHVEARREQILRAAYECFARRGFQKTTMREICRTAKLSPGAVYLYFRSKEQIIETLVRHYSEQRRVLMEPLDDDRDTGAALFGVLGGLSRLSPGPGAAELDLRLWAESLDTPVLRRLVRRSTGELIEGLTAILERGQDRGEVPSHVDARGLAWAILSLIAGFGLLNVFESDFEPETYFETVGSLLGAVIGKPPRGRP